MSKRRSHVASFAAKVRAMYSTSVDNNATVGCFFKHQLTNPLFSMKMKLEFDFRLFLLLAQSEFEYPSTKSLFWLRYIISRSLGFLRCCRVVFIPLVCW